MNFLDQKIVASAVIQPYDNDSFYNPETNNHAGYAYNGFFYIDGVAQPNLPMASWFTETPGEFRGSSRAFPTAGLILLSSTALTILDQSTPTLDPSTLPLWVQFILGDKLALTDNFNGGLNGWMPVKLTHANGIISVIYNPDPGNEVGVSPPIGSPPVIQSIMVVSFDFVRDQVYLDVSCLLI